MTATQEKAAPTPQPDVFTVCGYDIPRWDYPALDEVEALQAMEGKNPLQGLVDLLVVVLDCRLDVQVTAAQLRKQQFNIAAARKLAESMAESVRRASGASEGK